MDEDTIKLLTLAVATYRELRNRGIFGMPIEMRGLKGKALKAGQMFDRLNRAYDKLIETGDTHAGDVEGLAPQIDAMQDDVTFAAQTLGNSLGGSGDSEKAAESSPAVEQATTFPKA